MNSKLKLYADGGSRGNPGESGYGFIIKNGENEHVVSGYGYLGLTTNNVAEYTGLLNGLKYIFNEIESKPSEILVYMDSQLVIFQMIGKYRVKDKKLQDLFFEIKQLILDQNTSKVTFTHIERSLNKEADKLANIAMDTKETEVLF